MACSRVNFICLLYVHSAKEELKVFALTACAFMENGRIAAVILILALDGVRR
jgi:hypothetical protein